MTKFLHSLGWARKLTNINCKELIGLDMNTDSVESVILGEHKHLAITRGDAIAPIK